MNYSLHYERLISKSRNRSILKTEYKERHHVIPRCMGGDDSGENLIDLFPEEHLIAHLLLSKIHNSKELIYAAFRMSNYRKLSNKKYAWIRKKYAGILSGREVSQYTRDKISKTHKGRKWPKETNMKKGLKGENNYMYGKTHTEKIKRILSNQYFNQYNGYTDEEKQAIYDKIAISNSKKWKIISPTGYEMVITNLKLFCKENGVLYEGMLAVKNGKQKTHRGGWKCEII